MRTLQAQPVVWKENRPAQQKTTLSQLLWVFGDSRYNIKLEVYGRARREAARRRKSEWKVDLSIRNSSRSNGSWRMTT